MDTINPFIPTHDYNRLISVSLRDQITVIENEMCACKHRDLQVSDNISRLLLKQELIPWLTI